MRAAPVAFVAVVLASFSATAEKPEKAYVVVYDGWGTPASFTVGGRVLEDNGEHLAAKDATRLGNLVDNLKALDSQEIGGAEVVVEVFGRVYPATTDHDGVFRVVVTGLADAARLPKGDVAVKVSVVKPVLDCPPGVGAVWIADGPSLGLISDIDDTIVKTFVTEKKKMVGSVLLKNAKQSEAVVGAAKSYAKAKGAGVDAFFYVSGSPQNFYRRLRAFLDANGFPMGPIVLKNIGEDNMLEQYNYKIDRIEKLMAAMPTMRFVCVGDSGEKDPEVYAEIRKRHPDRVVAVLIRKVERSDVRPERFTGMTTIDDAYTGEDVIADLLKAPAPK